MAQTQTIEPHPLFKTWSPDEAAECLQGVPVNIYVKLWDQVEKVPAPGETPDTCFERGLAKVWDAFDDEDKRWLNSAAEAYMLEMFEPHDAKNITTYLKSGTN